MSWWDRLNDLDVNVTKALEDANESLSWDNFMNRGILTTGFQPYMNIFSDFFFGILVMSIALALFSVKSNIYYLIGYLIAVMILIRVIVPPTFADIGSLVLGLAVTVVIYQIFVRKHETKERAKR